MVVYSLAAMSLLWVLCSTLGVWYDNRTYEKIIPHITGFAKIAAKQRTEHLDEAPKIEEVKALDFRIAQKERRKSTYNIIGRTA